LRRQLRRRIDGYWLRRPVELALVYAADEGVPLRRGEVQDSSFRVLAVTNPDPVASQVRDLYAVTVI
jgi:hypothetical protein